MFRYLLINGGYATNEYATKEEVENALKQRMPNSYKDEIKSLHELASIGGVGIATIHPLTGIIITAIWRD